MKTRLEYQPDVTDANKLICKKYWSRQDDKRNTYIQTLREIGGELGLKHQIIPSIAKTNSYLVVLDCKCTSCNRNKVCYIRSELNQLKIDQWQCEECWGIYSAAREQEHLNCILKEEQVEEIREQAFLEYIIEYRNTQFAKIPLINELSKVDILLLDAVVKSLSAENLQTTIPLYNGLSLPLSPFYKLDKKILHRLFKLNILILEPRQNQDYVTFDQNKELVIDYNQATFGFTYSIEDITKVMVTAINEKNSSALLVDKEFKSWCQSIQVAECLSYLVAISQLKNLSPPVSEKMASLLAACLVKCSVSDMRYIIWKAVESASMFVRQPNTTHKYASNSIYGNISRVFDKISRGIWQSSKSYRGSGHPQSAISKIFFEDVFKIEDCDFNYRLDDLINQTKLELILRQTTYSEVNYFENPKYTIKIGDLNTL